MRFPEESSRTNLPATLMPLSAPEIPTTAVSLLFEMGPENTWANALESDAANAPRPNMRQSPIRAIRVESLFHPIRRFLPVGPRDGPEFALAGGRQGQR